MMERVFLDLSQNGKKIDMRCHIVIFDGMVLKNLTPDSIARGDETIRQTQKWEAERI